MDIELDSPSKLRKGEGIHFPATIMFKSQLSSVSLGKNELMYRREIKSSSQPFIESNILAPAHGDKLCFHIFDPAIYTPSKDISLNDIARKKLQKDLLDACSRTGGFKGVWKSLQYWGPKDFKHYRLCKLMCANSTVTTRTKCKANPTTNQTKKLPMYRFASTNNSKSLHSAVKGNSKRKRKTSKWVVIFNLFCL